MVIVYLTRLVLRFDFVSERNNVRDLRLLEVCQQARDFIFCDCIGHVYSCQSPICRNGRVGSERDGSRKSGMIVRVETLPELPHLP